jgi:calcineurin-like phosphoesterase family protein
MNIWISSDFHYNHKNITGPKVSNWKSGYRNFNSIQKMNDALINNINKCAKEDDILYFLGDWNFGDIPPQLSGKDLQGASLGVAEVFK